MDDYAVDLFYYYTKLLAPLTRGCLKNCYKCTLGKNYIQYTFNNTKNDVLSFTCSDT